MNERFGFNGQEFLTPQTMGYRMLLHPLRSAVNIEDMFPPSDDDRPGTREKRTPLNPNDTLTESLSLPTTERIASESTTSSLGYLALAV